MKYILLAAFLITIISSSSCRKSCSSCSQPIEEVKQEKLKVLLKEILDKLDLPFVPNVTKNHIPRIPPLEKVIHSKTADSNSVASDVEEDHYHSKTQKIILLPDKEDSWQTNQSTHSCYFSLTGKAGDPFLRINKAKLKIFIRRRSIKTKKSLSAQTGRINIYQKVYPIVKGVPGRILIGSKTIRPGQTSSWYHFKFRSVVRQWKNNQHKNLGIEMEVTSNPNYEIDLEKDTEPYLEIYVKNKKRRRRRRSPGLECGRGSDEKRCCRYPLIVDFMKIGWDFVMAPKRFMAYVCSGECSVQNPSHHLHGEIVKKATGRSSTCCAPKNFGDISMIYTDKNKVIFDTLPSVVALSCGCV